MIKSIKITNFCSIGEEQELSFRATKEDVLNDSSIEVEDYNVNLVNCLIGANASGKTTVLKALSFLLWFIRSSYESAQDSRIPVYAHKSREDELIKIEVELLKQNIVYRYVIELDDRRVHKESLRVEGVEKAIFSYERTGDDWKFETSLRINDNDLSRFKKRDNVAVLSGLVTTAYITELRFLWNYYSNVRERGIYTPSSDDAYFDLSKALADDKELRVEALRFMRQIDINIDSFEFEEISSSDGSKSMSVLMCARKTKSGGFKLPLAQESNGSVHSLRYFVKIYSVLRTGGIMLLDEIETGIHPHVAQKIVNLFENKKTNPRHAQLIFSTHQAFLLNDRTKTQIFLVEKDKEKFETEVYRLDEVKNVSDNANFFQEYLAGAYGGIPELTRFGE